MDPKKTGMIISNARKKLNITQKALADKLYVSDKAVSKWERGLCFPDISVLIPLTEILNISLYDLLRGEKMSKKEVEETLKSTIYYSNNELKKKKKKYVLISSIIILIILLISITILLFTSNNNDIGAIIDRDTLHDINHYNKYKTTLENSDEENLESLIMELPLNWKERQFEITKDKIKINYDITYSNMVRAYNDENYVKQAMIDIATVIFTMVSDTKSLEIKYRDYSFSISKEKLQKSYNISSFEEMLKTDDWNNMISNKLSNNDFINNTFKLFKKI